MSRFRLVAAILLVLLPVGAFAQTAPAQGSERDILPLKATEKVLPNGLKVIVVPTGFPNIVSLQIPVQTGARNEVEPGKSGFAHFFEHMMFRGTKAYPPDAYQAIITKSGARQNAYTSDDYTNYHTTFAKEDLETILKVEADRFQHLDYPLAAFKTESRAVLGEYNKNSQSPINKLFEVQKNSAFNAHPYKHTAMGFIEDIEDMPNEFDYSHQFFDRFYRPEYTTVIVAGDVKPEEVIPMVEKYWGGWKRGSYVANIPQEPAATGPVYANVPWATSTLPYVSVAFHGPAFSVSSKDYAALSTLFDLQFGDTSDIYKRLVESEQKVDQLFADAPDNADPTLYTVLARVKDPADAVYVRNEIMKTFARSMSEPVAAQRLADAKSNAKYAFVRRLDNTEAIAASLASFVRYDREFNTLNRFYALYDTLTPQDLQQAASKYFKDQNIVVTTLAKDPLPAEISKVPALASFAAPAASTTSDLQIITQKSAIPQLNVKLLFSVGSAHDPKGKEGLAALSAQMITNAGSKDMQISEINKALYPIAGGFSSQVDREMTTFTASIHRDKWQEFFRLALPQLLDPGFRDDDFKRVKDAQMNALVQDLRSNNDEELGKERLQEVLFAGTSYGHTTLGTVAGIESITIDDVRKFVHDAYTRGNLSIGIAGDAPDALTDMLRRELSSLAAAPAIAASQPVVAKKQSGIMVDIIEKDTRATAISFGHPIAVTRSHPDFAALWLARAWLGEHRSSMSHLYSRIREVRGMNYGDYAYIEAFPRGMYQFFPSPNLGRRNQIFEVWIRPVVPENGHMALRIALHELDNLITRGLSKQDFESTRDYLMKNVFVTTATQNQQLGYALDSKWYGIPEFTSYMRAQLQKLTAADVNRAVKKHLSAKDLSVVIITKDAAGMKAALIADTPSTIKYDGEKPAELLAEDKVIGARKLAIRAENVRITPVDSVFAK